MYKLIRKLDKLKYFLSLTLVAVITLEMGGVTSVFATNEATQQATTAQATTITIVGKVADTAVATITFPEGAPSATITIPYNDVDTVTDAQVLSATVSEPVVRLKNTSAGTLTVWLGISTWTNGAVAAEDYKLVATGTTNIEAVDSVLSADGNSASVDTAVTMGTGTYKALYLGIDLSALAGVSGTSTLTILGES